MTDLYVPSSGPIGGGSVSSNNLSEVTKWHQLNQNTELILGANPWLANDPNTLQRLAGSGAEPVDLVNNAAAMAGVESIDTMANALASLTPVGQRSAYSRLTEQQQRALAQMGYLPPQDSAGDGGIVGDVLGAVGTVAAPVMKPVASVLGPVVGPALNMLTWTGDVPAHFYRSIRQMDGWMQWVALGAAAAGMVALGPAAIAALGVSGSLGTIGTFGAIGLGSAVGATALGAAAGSMAGSNVTNVTEWWDVFNPLGATGVGRGERIFDQASQKRPRDILGGAEHLDAVARDIAANIDVYDLAIDFAGQRDAANENVMLAAVERTAATMADPQTPEFQRIYQGLITLVQQPEFQAAIDELQGGKQSFGRDIAGMFGLDRGDSMYGKVSGGADALWLMTMDPTMALGKIGVLSRMGRRGGRLLDGSPAGTQRIVRMLDEDPKVALQFDEIARAVRAEDFTLMPKAWATTFDDIVEFKRTAGRTEFSRADFTEWIVDQGGIAQIMAGKGTVRGNDHVRLSLQTRGDGWGKFVESVRRFQRGMTDEVLEDAMRKEADRLGVTKDLDAHIPQNAMEEFAEDTFTVLGDLDDVVAQSAAYASGQTAAKVLELVPGGRSFANFIGSISTMTPGSKAINLVGDEAAVQIPRFIESFGRHMNISGRVRDQWLKKVMSEGTVGQRRQVLKSFMDTGFTAAGMRQTDEMSTIVDDLLTKYDAAYGLGGINEVGTGGENVRAALGIYPDLHQQASIIVPDLGELSRLIRKGHILKHVAKATDHTFVEQTMSRVVKPSWLLRIGFIPRAAGEEMLAFWMRASETSIAAELGARSVGQGRAYQIAKQAEAAGKPLTDEMQKAIDKGYGIATHARPLAYVGRRFGWEAPEGNILENYTEWIRNAAETGAGWELHNQLPQWAQNIAFGKTNSWRRVLAEGVDQSLVESSTAYAALHSTAIMKAVSSNESSNFDTRLLQQQTSTVHLPDPRRPGKFLEVKVQLAQDGSVGTTDIAHRAGVHHRIQEPFMDDVVREPLVDALSSYMPETVTMSRADLADLVDEIPVQSMPARMIVQTLIDPRKDTINALAHTLRDSEFPEIAKAVRAARRHGDGNNLDEIVAELRSAADAAKNEAEALSLSVVADEIEQATPGLERLAGLEGDDRHWATMQVSRHLAKPLDTARLRRADGWVNRPPVVYYRDPAAYGDFRINDDGSMTLITGDPIEAGGSRSLRMATVNDRDTALIEIDGTWIHGEYSTDLDALRYEAGRGNEDAVKALRDKENNPFTEIELTVDEGEITIPAGRWRYDDIGDVTHAENGWTPMYESFADMREGFIEQLTRKLSDPTFDRSAISATIADAASGPLARAVPADVMRVYTPVIDADTQRVFAMLDQSQAQLPDSVVQSLHDLTGMTRSGDAFDPDVVSAILADLVEQTDNSTSIGISARRIQTQIRAGKIDSIDAVEELVEASKTPSNLTAVADELLGNASSSRAWNASVAELTELERRNIIQVALEEMSRNRATQQQPTVTALESLGFDNPNIAKWVSDILSDAIEPGSRRAAIIDLPFKMVDDAPAGVPDGVQSLTKTAEGRVLRLDDRFAGRGDLVDTTRIERAERTMYDPFDGTNTTGTEWRVGESYETGIKQYAERIADHVLNSQRRLQGDAVTDEIMWGIVSPMVRDSVEEGAGMGLITKKRNGGGDVNMTRARVGDVSSEPSATALPNLDIVADQWQYDGLWDKAVRFGWGKVIGPAIDGLAREPMAFHNFSRAFTENRKNLHWLINNDLFNKSLPEAFPEIARLDEIGSIDNIAGDLSRFLGDHNPALAKADGDPRAILATMFDDQDELDEAIALARQRNAGNPKMLTTLDKLDDLNYEAVAFGRSTAGSLGADSAAERFVMRFHETLPPEAWETTGTLRTALLEAPAKLGDLRYSDGQVETLFRAHRSLADALDIAAETAATRAIGNMEPFLDSHQQRSMFATYARNYLPFWYAEENFLKRWGRTLALSEVGGLDAVRKAQLTYMGLRSASVVRTDANGEDWVVYPGSGLLAEAVGKVLPGGAEPIGVLFQARTESLLPGINSEFGGASVSPFIAMPVSYTTHLFPDAADAKRALLGDIGASSNPLKQFVPSVVGRTWEAFQGEDSSEKYASAMMSAMAYAEAADQGLAANADPSQVEEYLDRMRNHARIIMLTQALAGYVVPGSPSALITGESNTSLSNLTGIGIEDPRGLVSEPYWELVSQLGMEAGTAEFLKLNPTADLEDLVNPLALTTSMNENVSGAPLPATRIGMEWYNQNSDWVDASPNAGAWFVPQDETDAEFDYYSYSQQLSSGLRKRKSPSDFITSIKFRAGAEVYFNASDEKEAALERASKAGDAASATAQVNDKWDAWRTTFLAANPLFAAELADNAPRVERRNNTIEQMRYAVTDPAAPDSPYIDGIKQMVEAFDNFTAQRTLLKDRRDAKSREQRRQLDTAFDNWATSWELRNPKLGRLWTSVYRPAANLG